MCIEYDNLCALVTSIPAHVGPVRSEKDYHLVTMVPHDLSQPQAEAVVIVTQSYVACKFLAISEDANAAFCWQLSAVDPYPTSDGVVQPGKAVGKLGPIADATDFKRGACLIVLHISKGSAHKIADATIIRFRAAFAYPRSPIIGAGIELSDAGLKAV